MDQAGRIHGNTTTTTTITETHVQTNIRFDPSYVKTIPGALKLAAVVSNYLSKVTSRLLLMGRNDLQSKMIIKYIIHIGFESGGFHLWR